MRKKKYNEAIMEIIELDFEDVLDVSTLDNTAIDEFNENTADNAVAITGDFWG